MKREATTCPKCGSAEITIYYTRDYIRGVDMNTKRVVMRGQSGRGRTEGVEG